MRQRASFLFELVLLAALCGLATTMYLPYARIKLFSALSIYALLIWRFVLKNKPVRTIPWDVILFSTLFFITLLTSAYRSHNQSYAFYMFDEYRFFFLGGLLFTAPLSARYRKIVLIVLFAGAAIDGLAGILQFYGLIYKGPDRPHGFAPFSTIYTARLAFVPATAIVMLIMKKKAPGGSNVWLSFLVLVAVLTSGGILLSGTRGTWIAIAVACPATLLLYSPKKALLFIMGFLAVFAVLFFSSDFFRSRSISAITSLQTPPAHTVLNGTHTRFELWKGSLLLAQESPLLGIGAGDFKANIERLTRENRLRETNDKIHAHNIFFQVLATQGITGLVALLGLVAALIRWGLKEIPERGGAGGYIIILCTLLAVVGGLTDNVLGMYRFVPIFYLIVGLAGPDWSGSFEGRQRSTIDKL